MRLFYPAARYTVMLSMLATVRRTTDIFMKGYQKCISGQRRTDEILKSSASGSGSRIFKGFFSVAK